FGFPETELGLIPAAGGCLRAPRLLGLTLARGMVLFGRELEAQEALAAGLASEVAPAGEVLEAAVAGAARAATRHPLATRSAKQAVGLAIPSGAALEYEGAAEAALYAARAPERP